MRRLTLTRETLTALTTDELTGVAAAATPLCVSNGCITDMATLCHLCALTPAITDALPPATRLTCVR